MWNNVMGSGALRDCREVIDMGRGLDIWQQRFISYWATDTGFLRPVLRWIFDIVTPPPKKKNNSTLI